MWAYRILEGLLWASCNGIRARHWSISASGDSVAREAPSWAPLGKVLQKAGMAPDGYLWALGAPGRPHLHLATIGGRFIDMERLEKVIEDDEINVGNIDIRNITLSPASMRRMANYIASNGTAHGLIYGGPGDRRKRFTSARWPLADDPRPGAMTCPPRRPRPRS